jgi:quercetin dioxygenase-like cupin family protein
MAKADWVYQVKGDPRGIQRTLKEGLHATVFPGENVMISIVRIDANTTGDLHSHPEEQWGVMLEGKGVRIQDGEEVEVTVGDFWHTPGGVMHGMRTGDAPVVNLDVFSPPRPEYKKAGTGYGGAEIKKDR